VITAVDTSVLMDVFVADQVFGARSAARLREAINLGSIVASEVVWAEVGAYFPDRHQTLTAMSTVHVEFRPVSAEAALLAGEHWRLYRLAGGSRSRLMPDFLIGAHALHQADRLLTRDRGFYRRYFADLTVIDPSDAS
jgi:hypothetical protein